MSSREKWMGALALSLSATLGCGEEEGAVEQTLPTAGPVTVFGRVSVDGRGMGAAPLEGGDVVVRGDFDADGTVEPNEVALATTDAKGFYQVTFEMLGKAALVARFSGPDLLDNTRRVVITPPSVMRLDASVTTGEALVANAVALGLPDGELQFRGLPDGHAGVARRFDPTREGYAFPGAFMDAQGNRIVSAVFANIALEDAQGQPVHELATPAELEMEVPQSTWRVLRDSTPGDGRIDVPYYAFDADSGQWVLETQAILIDETGNEIPESQLATITGGKFDGRVRAVSEVTHLSIWNVDFPTCTPPSADVYGKVSSALGPCSDNSCRGRGKVSPSTKSKLGNWLACTLGLATCKPTPPPPAGKPQKKDLPDFKWQPKPSEDHYFPASSTKAQSDELEPLSGAWITAELFYADGGPAGYIIGEMEPDGSFDIPIGRSESPGEDANQNGIAGEQYYARIVIEYQGFRFLLAEGLVPDFTNMVADLGDVDLSDSLIGGELCTLSGTVKYRDGKPAAGADVVLGSLGPVDPGQAEFLCGPEGASCTEFANAGSDGAFTLSAAVAEGVQLSAALATSVGPQDSWYWGDYLSALQSCPTAPVSVVLEYGATYTTLTLELAGGSIAWDPAVDIDALWVYGADDSVKWQVTAGSAPLKSPVAYGVLPGGAVEESPAVGQLTSGDFVTIELARTATSGYQELAHGEATVP